jgi:ubiquinone/menaquinone biosynthesis C-methylase UbiE
MSGADVWSERAQAYRDSPVHAQGKDLDLLVEWCEPGPGVSALDVATGGGHVSRRLREAGCNVVTVDPAPGMQPDVLGTAENLPFDDGSFDVVACRVAAHHFPDILAAVKEMARVTRGRVVVADLLFVSESAEEAERVRDPSHVRNYGADEWRSFYELAGLDVVEQQQVERRQEFEPWLERAGCTGEEAARVRELSKYRIVDGWISLPTIVIAGKKRTT